PIRAPSVSAGFLSEPRAPASGFPSVADPSLALRARINAGQPPIPNPQSSTLNPQSSFIKLTDFGLARLQSGQTTLTKPDAVLGTPEYMSPEQARGESEIDHRTDLYSAGVVLYEMLTGRTPFRSDTPTATIHRILHEEPQHPRRFDKDVDPNLASLALRLMAKRPEDRFASAGETSRALDANNHVQSPARRRRRVRAAIAIFSVAAGFLWFAVHLMLAARYTITNVNVHPDDKCAIQVQRGRRSWESFYVFPPVAEEVKAAQLVDLDGDDSRIVVAGIRGPLDGHGLFGFGARGQELWRMDLSVEHQWPDCAAPSAWECCYIASGDLDGRPGDELVVAASAPLEYATRISVVDPRTQRIRSTFWHMGDINQLAIVPDLLGPGRPAIVARGVNNKLDGFDEILPDDEEPVTCYDYVSVVMVLDPGDMDGMGPPRTHRLPGFPAARPFAYAFLDMAYNSGVTCRAESEGPGFPERVEVGAVDKLKVTPIHEADGNSRLHLELTIVAPAETEQQVRVILIVDPQLNLQHVVFVAPEKVATGKEFWRQRWRPLIQRGEYVSP
ncbi:MAG: serine/threonine-protein kinase, partial [Planctomycetota bacterium]